MYHADLLGGMAARLVIDKFRNRQGTDPVNNYQQVLPPKSSLIRRLAYAFGAI